MSGREEAPHWLLSLRCLVAFMICTHHFLEHHDFILALVADRSRTERRRVHYSQGVSSSHSPFIRPIRMRPGGEGMAEEGLVLERVVAEWEAEGRGVVVVEGEVRVAQPMIREWSLWQSRYKSCSPYGFPPYLCANHVCVPLSL